MNGFFNWFKSSAKMKRWIMLILIGILLTCYGLAQIIVSNEISFVEIGKVIIVFIVGFMCIVLGLIFANKRTLEVFIESTDERMENKKNVNVKSLIFNKTVYDKGPNIVVIGGGSGLNTVISGLKNYTSNITAIVTVSDYGQKPTELRTELDILPIDDIKDSIIALSNNDKEVGKLLNHKFEGGRLKGLSFSDIYFSAMKDIKGDFLNSIIKSNEIFNIIGKVIPVTTNEMKICAELDNGYIVEEKSRIPEVVYEKVTKINRIFINPSNCKPSPGVLEAIKQADCIIIGPGSLYTNVIPNLLVKGVAKTIKESKAIKVYISNIMTEPGQTDNYSVSEHINAIIEHCGNGIIDYCIYDTGEVIPEYIKKYNLEGAELVEQDLQKAKKKGIRFIQKNLSIISDNCIRHNSNVLASSIIELICEDLKYQDKQNDPQYIMMNTKLREDKRIDKLKRATEKSKRKNKTKKSTGKNKIRKSKFSNKYSERIASIKESDNKVLRKQTQDRLQKTKVDNKVSRKKADDKRVKKQ